VTQGSDANLTPAERVDDIPGMLRALQRAVREALWRHKLAGNSVAVWQDGRVVWISPADIPAPDAAPGED